jgi:hypothetical protein
MENLINSDMIWCVIAFLAFALGMTVSAKASKRCAGRQRVPLTLRSRLHCGDRVGGSCRSYPPGVEATVSESPREWCRQAHRAPAHGKEYTP